MQTDFYQVKLKTKLENQCVGQTKNMTITSYKVLYWFRSRINDRWQRAGFRKEDKLALRGAGGFPEADL